MSTPLKLYGTLYTSVSNTLYFIVTGVTWNRCTLKLDEISGNVQERHQQMLQHM